MNPPRRLLDLAARALQDDPRREIITRPAGSTAPSMRGADLLAGVESLSLLLRRRGVSPGDLVLLEEAAGERFLVTCLAAWGCDAAVIAPDPRTPPGELAALRDAFRPRWRVRGGEPPQEVVLDEDPSGAERALPERTAFVKLTSGSTGRPRGVAVSADQLESDGCHIIEGMGIRPEDLNVAAIPLSHSYGLGSLVMPLLLQATPMMMAEACPPESLSRLLSGERSMVFPGVPALFALLCREEVPALVPRGLRLCLSAGALLPPRVAHGFRRRAGLPVRAFYGTSETGGICFDASAAGDAAEKDEGGIGPPLPGVEVSLEEGSGRVLVRSAAVGLGYTSPDEESPGRFAEGLFHTGDTARLEQEPGGAIRLVLTGRVDALVNIAGRKVDPREVERALRRIAGVRDAVVSGVPDETRGETLAACLEAEPGLTRERVMERLREDLASWKLPRRVIFMQELPRTPRGKPDMDALRRTLRQAMEDQG